MTYKRLKDKDEKSITLKSNNNSLLLTGLEKYIAYQIKVAAFTAVGTGVVSQIITVSTDEDSK